MTPATANPIWILHQASKWAGEEPNEPFQLPPAITLQRPIPCEPTGNPPSVSYKSGRPPLAWNDGPFVGPNVVQAAGQFGPRPGMNDRYPVHVAVAVVIVIRKVYDRI